MSIATLERGVQPDPSTEYDTSTTPEPQLPDGIFAGLYKTAQNPYTPPIFRATAYAGIARGRLDPEVFENLRDGTPTYQLSADVQMREAVGRLRANQEPLADTQELPIISTDPTAEINGNELPDTTPTQEVPSIVAETTPLTLNLEEGGRHRRPSSLSIAINSLRERIARRKIARTERAIRNHEDSMRAARSLGKTGLRPY